jgi:hypothetical protein
MAGPILELVFPPGRRPTGPRLQQLRPSMHGAYALRFSSKLYFTQDKFLQKAVEVYLEQAQVTARSNW